MVVCFVGFYFPNPAIAAGTVPHYLEKSSIKVVDLTHPMQNGIPIWEAQWWGLTMPGRDEWGWYENYLLMSEHTGTHMDAPAHRIKKGWYIDEIPLDRLSGICVTMDMREVIAASGDPDYAVTAADIEAWEDATGIEIQEGDIVFMYTGWDELWDDTVLTNDTTYITEWPAIDETAAEYLRDLGIKGFGIDTLSIDPRPSDCPAHVTLYSANIWAIENLDNLGRIPTISYVFVAPMKIKAGSGAPTRVWAVFDKSRRGHGNFAEDLDEKLSALSAYDLAHNLEDGIPIWMAQWEFTTTKRDKWGWYENQLNMSEHTGTHMDAPAHRIKKGWYIDEIPLDHLYGSAVVMDMSEVIAAAEYPHNYTVTAEDIEDWEDTTGIEIQKGDIVFMYTGWDELWDKTVRNNDQAYIEDWPAIDQTAADYLRDQGIKGFGIDTLSIDPITSEYAHVTLYGENIWGLENIDNLSNLGDSRCYVIVMPWLLWHGSGGPCRIVAFS